MKNSHRQDSVEDFMSWYFNPIIFRMIMKRHRKMLPYRKLLQLLSFKHMYLRHSPYFLEWISFSARICNDSLYIRRQSIFIPSINTQTNAWGRYICPHIYIQKGSGKECSYHAGSTYSPIKKGLMNCRFCRTEFQIDFKMMNGVCLFMFLTIWKDLGQGRLHLDYDWQSHINTGDNKFASEVDFELGSLCSAFEQGRFRYDSIISPADVDDLIRIYWTYSENADQWRQEDAWKFFYNNHHHNGYTDDYHSSYGSKARYFLRNVSLLKDSGSS
ncbi:hypothetical protein F5884DRAFT_389405 [Xylogone sp. PMI_703]|nr:hypothetical protein F5884DRAFT_389405 [Xylogone sp. PMI_703]